MPHGSRGLSESEQLRPIPLIRGQPLSEPPLPTAGRREGADGTAVIPMTGLHFPVPHSPAEPGGVTADAPDACTDDDQPAGGQLIVNALRYPDRTGILRRATRLQLFTRVSQTKERGAAEKRERRKEKRNRSDTLCYEREREMFILPDSSFKSWAGE